MCRSVVFRNVAVTTAGCKSSRYHQEIATRGTIYDMDTDVSDKLAVTVGQVDVLPGYVLCRSEGYLEVVIRFKGYVVERFKPDKHWLF